MSRVDYGTVKLSLGDKEYELKPTLKAFMKIEQRWGGIVQAIDACRGVVIDPLVFIITAASGEKEGDKLAEAIFRAGVVNVSPSVIKYLALLLNPTGKEPEETEPGEAVH